MQLKCKINGVEHQIVQGNTFRDEYNETLDSGSIIVSQVEKLKDLKPFDDVYIYDNEFDGYISGYGEKTPILGSINLNLDFAMGFIKIEPSDELMKMLIKEEYDNIDYDILIRLVKKENLISNKPENVYFINYKITNYNKTDNSFNLYPIENKSLENPPIFNLKYESALGTYHFGFSFSELKYIPTNFLSCFFYKKRHNPENKNNFYKHLLVDRFSEEIINLDKKTYIYKIELFSETKGLEVVQLPNISITQPLNYNKKKSVWYYLNQFVDMYSPKIKMKTNSSDNKWEYVNKYTVSEGLRGIFEDVYAPDFSLNNPNLRDVLSRLMMVKDMIPYVKDGTIYAMDITKRGEEFEYDPEHFNFVSTSLSSDNFCDNLKRTYSDALTQDSSCRRVEYLGFRNSSTALMTIENMRVETNFPIYKINKMYMCYYKRVLIKYANQSGKATTKYLLCKQDITPLVKLDYELNYLNPDWMEFYQAEKKGEINNINDLARYKFATISYSRGSKNITGWGNKQTFLPFDDNILMTWYKKDRTYIENIFRFVDSHRPFGEISYDYLAETEQQIDYITPEYYENGYKDLIKNIPYYVNPKYIENGNEEEAGEKEINALKLKSFFFIVDYDAFYNGTVIHSKDDALDNIVINDNASSSLTVLENDGLHQKEKINRYGNKGFTILARYKGDEFDKIKNLGDVYNDGENEDIIIYHREISIFDNVINCKYYGMKDYVLKNFFTSVYAKHRTYNLMSFGESTRRSENEKVYLYLSKNNQYYENVDIFQSDGMLEKMFSFMKENDVDSKTLQVKNIDAINGGYISFNSNNYSCDVNAFVTGYSMCFNISMFDNVSPGIYIEKRNPTFPENIANIGEDIKDDYTGSLQSYYLTVDDEETGFATNMGFNVSHVNNEENLLVIESDLNKIKEKYNNLEMLPKINEEYERTNIIGKDFNINKDNKELIDMTFQFEPITTDKNVLFSQWLMKLSDLAEKNYKMIETKNIYYNSNPELFSLDIRSKNTNYSMVNFIVLRIKKDFLKEKYESRRKNINFRNPQSIAFDSGAKNLSSQYLRLFYLEYIFNEFEIIKEGEDYHLESKNHTQKAKYYAGDDDEIYEFTTSEEYTEKLIFKHYVPNQTLEDSYIDDFYFEDDSEYDYYILEIKKVRVWTGDYNNIYFTTLPYDKDDKDGRIIAYNEGGLRPLDEQWLWSDLGIILLIPENLKVFERNMYIKISKSPMKKTIVYDEYPLEYITENSEFNQLDEELLPSDIFSVNENKIETDLNYLRRKGYSINEIGSIQQWYYDNGSLKFVFGVNVTGKDKLKFDISYFYKMPIYISMLSRRDTRVYDEYHNIVGNVTNCVDEPDSWGTQKYTPKGNS